MKLGKVETDAEAERSQAARERSREKHGERRRETWRGERDANVGSLVCALAEKEMQRERESAHKINEMWRCPLTLLTRKAFQLVRARADKL